MSPDQIRLLRGFGLSADQILAVLEAGEDASRRSGTAEGYARRQRAYRARKRDQGITQGITGHNGSRHNERHNAGITQDCALSLSNIIDLEDKRERKRDAVMPSRVPENFTFDQSVWDTASLMGFSRGYAEFELSKFRDWEFDRAWGDWNAAAKVWLKRSKKQPEGWSLPRPGPRIIDYRAEQLRQQAEREAQHG